MENLNTIKNDLKKILSKQRYEHSLLVAIHAKKLAKLYNVDEEKAYIAGLVHDIAKEFSDEENKKWIEKYNMPKELLDPKYSKIIHANIGAIVVKQWYNFDDDICNSVCYHTIGHVPMTTLEKIVFIADKIGRTEMNDFFEKVKKLAYEDLDESLIFFIDSEKNYLENKGQEIHPTTLKLLDNLKKETINRKL